MTMPAIDDDGDRVHHRALDLALELDRLLDVGGQALQDGVEDTARLAGRDHVDEQVVEGLRVLAHGVGEGGAAFHVHARLLEDLGEGLVLLLAAQDLEALDEGQTGVDHDRELAHEDGQVLGGDAASELRQDHLLALLLDGGDQDLVPAQEGHDGFLVLGHALARNRLAVAGLAFPDVSRHQDLLRTASSTLRPCFIDGMPSTVPPGERVAGLRPAGWTGRRRG